MERAINLLRLEIADHIIAADNEKKSHNREINALLKAIDRLKEAAKLG